ncbi:MAG TPA: amino acid decarboxylase, partial [Lachnospiraceae bacterium]|nr:amino acid decarboxylase [Lachnospiraceae bacterium]
MDGLYDKLVKYSKEDYYPMHMPGHKRNTSFLSMENPYAIDITEIPGFDNLHQPEDILRLLSERISKLYHS